MIFSWPYFQPIAKLSSSAERTETLCIPLPVSHHLGKRQPWKMPMLKSLLTCSLGLRLVVPEIKCTEICRQTKNPTATRKEIQYRVAHNLKLFRFVTWWIRCQSKLKGKCIELFSSFRYVIKPCPYAIYQSSDSFGPQHTFPQNSMSRKSLGSLFFCWVFLLLIIITKVCAQQSEMHSRPLPSPTHLGNSSPINWGRVTKAGLDFRTLGKCSQTPDSWDSIDGSVARVKLLRNRRGRKEHAQWGPPRFVNIGGKYFQENIQAGGNAKNSRMRGECGQRSQTADHLLLWSRGEWSILE